MPAKKLDSETIREEGVNVHLAQLLRDRGVSARAERRSRKGVPDVRVELRTGDRIVLECKWEGSLGLLENQLDDRLNDFPEAIGMMGVLYPARLREAEDTRSELQDANDLQWWLHGSRGKTAARQPVRKGELGRAQKSRLTTAPRLGRKGYSALPTSGTFDIVRRPDGIRVRTPTSHGPLPRPPLPGRRPFRNPGPT